GTAALDIGLLIAHIDAALDAVEERGGQGDEAVGGEAVRELLDVRVDAEDLLDDDESAAGLALGRRPVRAELESILGREVDHLSHRGALLFLVVSVERAWRDRAPNQRSASSDRARHGRGGLRYRPRRRRARLPSTAP